MPDFSDETIQRIWERAKKDEILDPDKYRLCPCLEAVIRRDAYGNQRSEYGWNIDHIFPKDAFFESASEEKINHPENLRAMHWKNNQQGKSNNYPHYKAAVKRGKDEGKKPKNEKANNAMTVNEHAQERIKKLYPNELKRKLAENEKMAY